MGFSDHFPVKENWIMSEFSDMEEVTLEPGTCPIMGCHMGPDTSFSRAM